MADIEKVIKGLECCLRESEHIDDNPCKNCPYYDVDSGIGGRCMEEKDKDVIELLKEQQPKWIPINERLPEEKETVLLSDGYDVFYGFMTTKRDFALVDEALYKAKNTGKNKVVIS